MLKKSNLIKHGGMALLYTACISFCGLKMYDDNFDHTKEVCPVGKINHFHQMQEMTKDYLEKYQRQVDFSYVPDYFKEENQYSYVVPLANGSVDYVIPDGYTIDENFMVQKENGEYGAIVPDENNSDIPAMRIK